MSTKHHIPDWAADDSCLHNPDNLRPETVGEGWRLLLKEEADCRRAGTCQAWIVDGWDNRYWNGDSSTTSYRLPLSVPWPEQKVGQAPADTEKRVTVTDEEVEAAQVIVGRWLMEHSEVNALVMEKRIVNGLKGYVASVTPNDFLAKQLEEAKVELSAIREQARWVPIEERKPTREDGCFYKGFTCGVQFTDGNQYWVCRWDDGFNFNGFTPTHWRRIDFPAPIPSDPFEEWWNQKQRVDWIHRDNVKSDAKRAWTAALKSKEGAK
jgi:hypothetical protein